jgi:hypothetical protein
VKSRKAEGRFGEDSIIASVIGSVADTKIKGKFEDTAGGSTGI